MPQVFERHVLGAGSDVAATLRVDGANSALRCELGDMLNEVLGRQARKTELQVRANMRAEGCRVG